MFRSSVPKFFRYAVFHLHDFFQRSSIRLLFAVFQTEKIFPCQFRQIFTQYVVRCNVIMLAQNQKSVPEAKDILLFQFFQCINSRCFRHFPNCFRKRKIFKFADKSKYITTFAAVKTGVDLIMEKIQGIGFAVTEWALTAVFLDHFVFFHHRGKRIFQADKLQ